MSSADEVEVVFLQELCDALRSPSGVLRCTGVCSGPSGCTGGVLGVYHDLVSSADEVEVVFLQELGDDLRSERERHAAIILSPANHVLVWVGPEQVAQQALIWHVCGSHDATDLLHRLQVRTQAYTPQCQVYYGCAAGVQWVCSVRLWVA